jgi:hypothetical protein
MRILFCADPLSPRMPDTMYEEEVSAAEQIGIPYSLINFERLVYDRQPTAAIAAISSSEQGDLCLFRGWMMTPEQYTSLYEALQAKGLTLINTPIAYRHCHYLPENYPIIKPYTAKSVWLPYTGKLDMDAVMATLEPFGGRSLILKDYVKSRKYEWFEACYIPSADNRAEVERVTTRFLELQGEEINEGLVFREFLPFRPLRIHSKSGMPLTIEYRCFVLDGEIQMAIPYWEEGDYAVNPPPLANFAAVARQVQSRFYTMDIAQHEEGHWLIVELGDGQVAGLPETASPKQFYKVVAEAFHRS